MAEIRIAWPDPEGQEIVERLFAADAALRAHFEQVTAAVGLTVPQAHTLIQLQEPQRMGTMAGHLHCEPSHVTAIADSLEAGGLLRREPDPDDRRAKRLVLTEAGQELRGRLLKLLFEGAPIISTLDAEQRAGLLAMLRMAQSGDGHRALRRFPAARGDDSCPPVPS
ncbi:MarR family winged helix-turn-helix transcriptional regulator [Nonomuraea rhodomycinica]|uniref:MarR family transcriptional regulator n=1 Tax=Nonomuraea rhodomycinica TaxID=1712872 RepID=A0A7Y6IYB4_9ACTN|nr:MarR family transcriptional regulator [Nonomuraea rhodomycinica]NUW46088.1 MarR family transcriptional regulator [Nonomuraea rhodomycinica]